MAYNEAYTVTIASVLGRGGSIRIQAPMPESFMHDAAVMYEAPFAQAQSGNAIIDTLMKVGMSAKLVTHAMTAQVWQGSAETELGFELEFHAEEDPVKEVRDPILQLMKLSTASTDRFGLLESPGPKIDWKILQDIGASSRSTYDDYAGTQIPPGTQGEVSQGQMSNPNMSTYQGDGHNVRAANPGSQTSLGVVDYLKSRINDQISIKIGKYAFFDSVVITNVQKTYESQFDADTGLPFYAKVAVRFKPLFMITQADLDKIYGASGGSIVATGPAQTL